MAEIITLSRVTREDAPHAVAEPTLAEQAEAVEALSREVLAAADWLVKRKVPAADLGRLVRRLDAAAATLRRCAGEDGAA
jgi:hypothetical protein